KDSIRKICAPRGRCSALGGGSARGRCKAAAAVAANLLFRRNPRGNTACRERAARVAQERWGCCRSGGSTMIATDVFSACTINNVRFKNRIVRSSVGGRTANYDGTVTDVWKNFEKRF